MPAFASLPIAHSCKPKQKHVHRVLPHQTPRERMSTQSTGAEELCDELYVTVNVTEISTFRVHSSTGKGGWSLAHASMALDPPQNHNEITENKCSTK